MTLEHIINHESSQRILKALLDGEEDISSSSSEWRYLTTRITNQISALRKSGIDIETKTVKVPDSRKYYGRYVLAQDKQNIERAVLLLEKLEEKLA